jgi:6-phosphogluconolactonase
VTIEIFPDIGALAGAAAEYVAVAAREAVQKRQRFVMALSGGHSPRPLYRLLSEPPYRSGIPWRQAFILWSDERYVPPDDERSNAGAARELLLRHVPVPDAQILPMYREGVAPDEAALLYEDEIVRLFGSEPRLDLVLLGCGENGHTASLFPGTPVLRDRRALVRAVTPSESNVPRITMTPVLLNRSRRVLFIAFGRTKAEVIHRVLEGPPRPEKLPAQAVRPRDGELSWYLDESAASQLREANIP